MAVNAAFTAQTSNATGTGYALSGTTAVVEVQQDSVMGTASVLIEACSADTTAKYQLTDPELGVIRTPGQRVVVLAAGWYVRLKVAGVTSALPTSINATVTT